MVATTAPQRLAQLPDVPTVTESGLPGFDAAGWYGFFAPAETPRPILEKLNGEIVKALNAADLREQIQKMGLVPAPQSLEEASRFVAAEAVKWSRAVRASGATAD